MLRSAYRNLPSVSRLLPYPPERPRVFPTGGFSLIDIGEKVEEEKLAHYRPERFYAARLGEVFQSRYQAIGKLGYGAHSTAWLCRDLSKHQYVTVKICESTSISAKRELAAYFHINSLWTRHVGRTLVRTLLDHFELEGQDEHKHLCLVHEPLSISVEQLQHLSPRNISNAMLAKTTLHHLLLALDFLHTKAGIVHGDLQTANIHCQIPPNDASLTTFEQSALTTFVDRKFSSNNRTIYRSQSMTLPETLGRPILCDLGESRMGQNSYSGTLQPIPYRSPEVILGIPWSYSADIWNVAQVAWTTMEGGLLFTGKDAEGEAKYDHHLAQMVAVMDAPPKSLLERSSSAAEYFDDAGKLIEAYEYPRRSLEEQMANVDAGEKAGFVAFMRKMLCWVPEERQTAGQLLQDPWLNG